MSVPLLDPLGRVKTWLLFLAPPTAEGRSQDVTNVLSTVNQKDVCPNIIGPSDVTTHQEIKGEDNKTSQDTSSWVLRFNYKIDAGVLWEMSTPKPVENLAIPSE